MIDLKQNTILREIPQNLLVDPRVEHLAQSLQKSIDDMLEWVDKINYRINLDELPDEIIDHLLWESHITWSEGLEIIKTREQKIEFIRNGISLHRLKGTPAALELVFALLEMSCELKEWYEYDGDPYHFKVEIATASLLNGEKQLLRNLINEYKNVRSQLDFIAVQLPQTQHIELESDHFQYPLHLPICGTFYCDGIPGTKQDTTIEMQSEQYQYPVSLPITGEIYPNEVINEW